MLISTASVVGWRDLQEKTQQLFAEMNYEAEVSKVVELAGRGKKEIDVFVTDPHASYNKVYLVECKHWESRVPQEVVHSFKTVMEETGANTGFIVSKVGFQSGAYDAARFTNIKLLTFDELQHLYGNEWFRKQMAKLECQVERLCAISHLHFDQWNMLGFHNNKFFRTDEQLDRLGYFHRWMNNLIIDSRGHFPGSYAGPEPVQICNDPANPEQQQADWFRLPTVRDYFVAMTAAVTACADQFDSFFNDAAKSFESLPDTEQDAIESHVLRVLTEELPIRALERHISSEEYHRLLQLLSSNDGKSSV
jgi:hypothetical protein